MYVNDQCLIQQIARLMIHICYVVMLLLYVMAPIGHHLPRNTVIINDVQRVFNSLMPELNPSAQRWLTRFFTRDFASWTLHFVNVCLKNQQIHQLFIQFIYYVW
jgi:hypothetical protein